MMRASFSLHEIIGLRHRTKSWNTASGRFSTRWASRGAVFTHFATHIHHYSSTRVRHLKLFNVNCDTLMPEH